jgi:hypothetical protein
VRFVSGGKEVAGILDPTGRWRIGLVPNGDKASLVVVDTQTGWNVYASGNKGIDMIQVLPGGNEVMALIRRDKSTVMAVGSEKGSNFNYNLVGDGGPSSAMYSGPSGADGSIGYTWYDLNVDGQFDIREEPGKKRWIRFQDDWVDVNGLDPAKRWAKDDKGNEYKFDDKKGVWVRQ